MKNDELEPIQQVGIALTFVGLDLFLNDGRITSNLCKLFAEKCHEQIEANNEKQ